MYLLMHYKFPSVYSQLLSAIVIILSHLYIQDKLSNLKTNR